MRVLVVDDKGNLHRSEGKVEVVAMFYKEEFVLISAKDYKGSCADLEKLLTPKHVEMVERLLKDLT